ncbi:sulfatase-like hydrolase/transferase [Sphaerimonospora thailandensis]|uniref:Arylsulfatase n=1 Tax=Sphaerimonospora thailandensis TaxID=795644 RepID=A0A8J3VX52_9ACTN|nr:sulfatase-like hydrolase/transferase [Sphaerimonospora thailandensis]GIH68072.1 arylsulfatase [Sphaerimonospora thailandensis]
MPHRSPEPDSPDLSMPHAPEGAPNVVLVLLDDVGFGASAPFGGPVETPAIEELAREGLRYNRFHTTAICSPTRASLLTGRDAHVAGVGTVMNSANKYPGYQGILRDSTATIATVLRKNGYSTACFGKWHLAPPWETSQIGPFDRWPTGRGFDTFYGFLGGETHQYEPTLYQGTTPVARPDGDDYHLTEDLVDRSIEWIRMQNSLAPDRPFLLYLAPGATHAPLHVPGMWSEKYRGRFAQGWDAVRQEILDRQKALGVVPEDTELTPRPDELPAWDTLRDDEKRVAERLMEVYAGFLEHTDVQIARLIAALKESGQFDNTLFVYVVGDNGSSAEAGMKGSINYFGALQGMQEPIEVQIERLDEIGGKKSYPQYPAGWAWAMTAPFQWVKQVASHFGGTRNPMVVSWPAGIRDAGGLRSQFSHVNDIVPTILDVAGIEPPAVVDGVEQAPMDGTSLVYSFDDADAPERHTTQYFEVFGHRSIYHDGWIASAFHRAGMPWTVGLPPVDAPFEADVWELYDTRRDFSQARDLAGSEPERLAELQELFAKEAARVDIQPLRDARARRTPMPNLATGRTRFAYHRGAVGTPETNAPPLRARSWTMRAHIDVPGGGARGVLASMGGDNAGWALYLTQDGRPEFVYRAFEAGRVHLAGPAAVPTGRHVLEVDLAYDGGGPGRGAQITLRLDGAELGSDRTPRTPRGFFSIDETFDVGATSGSPVGNYPHVYPFEGGLDRVEFEVH